MKIHFHKDERVIRLYKNKAEKVLSIVFWFLYGDAESGWKRNVKINYNYNASKVSEDQFNNLKFDVSL